ncbi:hypothetical protein HMPREF0653_01401 [Prevotella disiens JCM 6334 = ATCC 29426]|uniref:Uncharacterized protein n=1 Tax=Prevotella disiens JCM 6334 = ATCC 29426 TaxID=1235811 RepID=A0ABN0NS62_9BACT|nr:hypothetical protein HMPREF0653_01401 [Prevotella disiens JCM 6334 = ATCC 29426]
MFSFCLIVCGTSVCPEFINVCICFFTMQIFCYPSAKVTKFLDYLK